MRKNNCGLESAFVFQQNIDMRCTRDIPCPCCGGKLQLDRSKSSPWHDRYTCRKCGRTFAVKYNWILLFIEMFAVLKVLDLLSRAIAGRLVFTVNLQLAALLIEAGLALLLSRFQPWILLKLKIMRFVDMEEEKLS